jgi:hypothetical protein
MPHFGIVMTEPAIENIIVDVEISKKVLMDFPSATPFSIEITRCKPPTAGGGTATPTINECCVEVSALQPWRVTARVVRVAVVRATICENSASGAS